MRHKPRACNAAADNWCEATCGVGSVAEELVDGNVSRAPRVWHCRAGMAGQTCNSSQASTGSFETAEQSAVRSALEATSPTCAARHFNRLAGGVAPPRCGLLLLAHVPKAGGSTVKAFARSLPGWSSQFSHYRFHGKLFAALDANASWWRERRLYPDVGPDPADSQTHA